MSGLKKMFKKAKKAFKKIVKSPIFKAIAVAAVVWFTAGTAAAYFAAPQAGIGAAMSTSASSMWASTTTFFGAEAATTLGASVETGTTLGAAAVNAESAVAVTEGLTIGQSAAELEAATAFANTSYAGEVSAATYAGGADAAIAAETANAASVAAATPGALTGAGEAVMGSGLSAPGQVIGSGAGISAPMTNMTFAQPSMMGVGEVVAGAAEAAIPQTGMMGWLAANPMATMMLGQAVTGAAAGYEADKSAERMQDAEDERLRNRGLMGFDHLGNRAPRRGTVSTEMAPTVAQTVAEPGQDPAAPAAPAAPATAPQQVAAPVAPAPPTPTAQQVAVPREQLPQMNQQGAFA